MNDKLNAVAPAQVDYPEPIPLIPDVEQGQPYPVDALPPLMAGATREIAQIAQVPEAMAAQCVIGAVTHLAQGRINADHPLDIHKTGMPCSMLILTLGDSGDGKSRSRDLAFWPIDEAERERITEQARAKEDLLSEAQGLAGKEAAALREEAASLSDGKVLFDDASVEGLVGRFIRGMATASWDTDEGGQFFGGYSLQADTRRNTLGALTKIYDKGIASRTRSVSNEEGSGTAYDRRLTVHILVQEVVVRESLADPLMRGQGLLARFLFAAPSSLAGTRITDADLLIKQRNTGGVHYEQLEAYWGRCRQILAIPEAVEHGEVRAQIMPLDDAAVRCLIEFNNSVERQLVPLGDYFDVKAFARRALEQAARLCAIFAYFDNQQVVSYEMAEKAARIAQHSLDEWTRHSAGVVVSPLIQQATHFMEWLQDPKRASSWEEFDKNRLSKSAPSALRGNAKLRNEVLLLLIEHHYLLAEGNAYRVNPLLGVRDMRDLRGNEGKANNHKGYSEYHECGESAGTCGESAGNRSHPAEIPHHPANTPQIEKGGKASNHAAYVKNPADPADPATSNADTEIL